VLRRSSRPFVHRGELRDLPYVDWAVEPETVAITTPEHLRCSSTIRELWKVYGVGIGQIG
jgi:hypothetical protein